MATRATEVGPSAELYSLVAAYLRGRLAPRDLQKWLVRHTSWTMTAQPDPAAELAGLLELSFAELSAGHATEADLRSDIEAFLHDHATLNVAVNVADFTDSTTPLVVGHVGFRPVQGPLSGTRPAGAPA